MKEPYNIYIGSKIKNDTKTYLLYHNIIKNEVKMAAMCDGDGELKEEHMECDKCDKCDEGDQGYSGYCGDGEGRVRMYGGGTLRTLSSADDERVFLCHHPGARVEGSSPRGVQD